MTAANAQETPAATPTGRLIPPEDGAVVRMYRIGHGDCFLIAFPGEKKNQPVYVLIDCGYKPGSPGFIPIPTTVGDITQNLREATGGEIDVAIITHEHQDHVNGITEKNFEGIKIKQTWLAWTEDDNDELANQLRKRFKDKLLGLISARNRMGTADDSSRKLIDELLEFELGGDRDPETPYNVAAAELQMNAANGAPQSMNKVSMKLFKDRASEGVTFLRPDDPIRPLSGAKSARVFTFGPPRDESLLTDLDPEGAEEFHLRAFGALGSDSGNTSGGGGPPFARRYCVDLPKMADDSRYGDFFQKRYGKDDRAECPREYDDEVPSNPSWRRIDREWVNSAEQLALAMNDYTNNASLVLAFELKPGGKVLFFAADAQRGNWISWKARSWKDGASTLSARDVLSRAVLYKVGHHGSHNATLNGTALDPHVNLGWMGQGEHSREFTAMITAVRKWAETQKGWDHPLKAIKDALLAKASGRVFQTDTDLPNMSPSGNGSTTDWNNFLKRAAGDRLYFDLTVRD